MLLYNFVYIIVAINSHLHKYMQYYCMVDIVALLDNNKSLYPWNYMQYKEWFRNGMPKSI